MTLGGIIVALTFFNAYNNVSERPNSTEIPLKTIMLENSFEKENFSVLVDKSDFRLYACINDSIIKSYPVVFGGNQTDDKLMQGDKCTPEGKFRIRAKYPHDGWNKFMWVDYPNTDSWKKHNQAKTDGKIPSYAKIGGEIGIHGVPMGNDWLVTQKVNWTLGCISLRNADIDEIYPYFHDNIWVTIRK